MAIASPVEIRPGRAWAGCWAWAGSPSCGMLMGAALALGELDAFWVGLSAIAACAVLTTFASARCC